MATPRKHWSKLADSVWREPWPLEMKGLFLNLHCFLNERWARDQLEPEEAGSVALSPEMVNALTGSKHLRRGRRLLEILSNIVSISVQYSDEITTISWPKYPKFQGYKTRESPPPTPAPRPKKQKRSRSSQKREASADSKQEKNANGSPTRALNLIAKLPGSRREKELWYADQAASIEAEVGVVMQERHCSESVAFRSVLTRFYKHYTREDAPGREFYLKAMAEVGKSKIVESGESSPFEPDGEDEEFEL